MSQIFWGPELMPKSYSSQEQRDLVFRRMYWNSKQNRIMWEFVSNENKKPIVLFSIPKATGTSYHRIQQPIRRLQNKYPNDYIFVYAQPATVSDCLKCDILQLHRAAPCHDSIYEFFKKLPPEVKKPVIVNNIDDLQYQIPKTHYLYSEWMAAGKDKMSVRMFKESDYNLITSWNYQKIIERDIGYNIIQGKTHRFPNWIDYELPQWSHAKKNKNNEVIKIGWIGLVSHNIDLVYIHNIWKRLSQKYGNKIQFVLSSPNPDEIEFRDEQHQISFTRKKYPGERQYGFTEYINNLFKDVTKSKVTIIDALPLSEYGKLYRQLDISFIVVQPTKFNKAKSQIKITQSVINRCIPIYNNFGPYSEWDQKCRNYIKRNYGSSEQATIARRLLNMCGHNIVGVNATSSWVKAVSSFIDNWDNEEFSKSKQIFMDIIYKFNIRQYGMNENIEKRKRFYDMIIEKK